MIITNLEGFDRIHKTYISLEDSASKDGADSKISSLIDSKVSSLSFDFVFSQVLSETVRTIGILSARERIWNLVSDDPVPKKEDGVVDRYFGALDREIPEQENLEEKMDEIVAQVRGKNYDQ